MSKTTRPPPHTPVFVRYPAATALHDTFITVINTIDNHFPFLMEVIGANSCRVNEDAGSQTPATSRSTSCGAAVIGRRDLCSSTDDSSCSGAFTRMRAGCLVLADGGS